MPRKETHANPPDEILAAVRKLVDGDYSAPVALSGGSEDLGALFEALNQIASRLSEQTKQTEELQRQFDQVVEKHRRLITGFPGVVYIIQVTRDKSYCFPFISENAWEVLGIRAEDIMRDPAILSGARHPDDMIPMDRAIRQSVRTMQPFHFEVRHLVRGEYRWFECLSRPAQLPDGRVALDGFGFMLDVTRRKEAEQALRESEERYRLLAENATDIIWTTNMNLRFTYLSPSYTDFFGFSVEEGLQKTMEEMTTPESFRRAMEVFGEEMAKEESGAKDYQRTRTLELEIFHENDSPLWVEATVKFLRDSQNHPIGLQGATRVITERKRIEESLMKSEKLLKESQQVAHIGSYEWDIVGKKWRSTKTLDDIFGIDDSYPKTLKSWGDIIHHDHRQEVGNHLRQVVDGQRAFDIKYRIVPFNGTGERWVHGIGQLLVDAAGRPVRLVGTVQDITDQKRAEEEKAQLQEQLNQAQKMESIGRLAGGVAHDFNNILTGILGNIELVLLELGQGDPLRETLNEVHQAAESAAHLTRQLLTFSRKQLIEPKILNLNDVITHTQKMLCRLIGENIELKTILDTEHLGQVKIDQGQAEQILVNLAVNARDAMPNGGKLTLETARVSLDQEYCLRHPGTQPGDYVMLAVSDNGVGMDEAVRKRLFEPFFTTKEKGKGTGLGLASVYGAVKQSGGNIEIYSEPGVGTTFKIYLPRMETQPEPLVWIIQDATLKGTETVVLVEDEEIVKAMAAKALKRLGYKVFSFTNGGEAWMAIQKLDEQVHLLITDVIMPGVNGQVLAETVSLLRPGIKVLFASGYTENVIVHHGVLEDGVEFIQKPYSPNELAKKVRQVLDKT